MQNIKYTPLGTIALNQIRTFSFHGCLKEEGLIGSDYEVSLKLHTSLKKAGESDSLSDTIDYVAVHKLVVGEMDKKSKLIENVARRILNVLFKEFPELDSAEVEVSKINPPLGGDVASVTVIMADNR